MPTTYTNIAEIGRDHLHSLGAQPHKVLGGVISPAHDNYRKHKPVKQTPVRQRISL